MKLTELEQRMREKYTRIKEHSTQFGNEYNIQIRLGKWESWRWMTDEQRAFETCDRLARALAKIVREER